MKKVNNKLLLIIFVIVYTISCVTLSVPLKGNYFHYNSFNFQLIKFVIVASAMFLVTIINHKNIKVITDYTVVFTTALSITCFVDYYFTHIIVGLSLFSLWWLATVHLANAGAYMAIISGSDTYQYAGKFLKGYTSLYILTFIIVFLRPVGDTATINLNLGNGTLRFIPYLISNPKDADIWFNFIGNIFFFSPLAFISKAIIPKIKIHYQLLIGLIIPLLIEGYQLIFRCGDVDVDDLVLNYSGFIIGLILLKIQELIIKTKKAYSD